MSHDTGRPPSSAAVWVDSMIRAAYPETAGITLAALEVLAGQETFTAAQAAYLMSVMFDIGAQARTAGDRAEVRASCASNFAPRPTRDERISLRVRAMEEQHEIAWLRRYDRAPEEWTGGTAEQAQERFMWPEERKYGIRESDRIDS